MILVLTIFIFTLIILNSIAINRLNKEVERQEELINRLNEKQYEAKKLYRV